MGNPLQDSPNGTFGQLNQIIKFFIARLYPYVKPFLYLFNPRREGVKVLIFHEDKLLLIKNTYRNGWTLPGGSVKKNELLKDAAIREVYEEVGIKINNLGKQGFFTLPIKGWGKITVFSCTVKSTQLKIDNLEVEDAKWVDINEVSTLHLLPVAAKCVKMCSHLLLSPRIITRKKVVLWA